LTGWRDLAVRLAETIAAEGNLSDPAWRDAFATVPRHVFVPRFLRDDSSVVDGTDPSDRGDWLAAVYSDTSLTTHRAPVPGTNLQWPISSSTRPSLMARMFHLLHVAEGHRVLEIGTGTGYSTALLCQRLDDNSITTIDIHPDLVNQARDRLASLGYWPHLHVGDGVDGVPVQAPYDRILATCAVPTVPPAWIRQLSEAGMIVADIRGELSSSLVALRRTDDKTVEGRFLAVPGHFMWLRAAADNPLRTGGSLESTIDRDNTGRAETNVDPTILKTPGLRFLLQHPPPAIEQIWSAPRDGIQLTHIHAQDGSWAEVEPACGGRHIVTQGGPRPIWSLAEETIHLWSRLGQPTRERFGLTATSTGSHRVWLDRPGSEHTWQLQAR
jgi:methyltransferase of ATP-grasp peptide maturase system